MDYDLDLDSEKIFEAAKPIFYGFIALAALTITVSPEYAGTLLGVAVMASISFTAANFSVMMEERWSEFLDGVAVLTLLATVLAASYVTLSLSLLG